MSCGPLMFNYHRLQKKRRKEMLLKKTLPNSLNNFTQTSTLARERKHVGRQEYEHTLEQVEKRERAVTSSPATKTATSGFYG